MESVFDNIPSKQDKVQDLNNSQLKREVYDTYKTDEKLTTKFEAVNDEDVTNEGYLGTKLSEIGDHFSVSEKNYNEFDLQNNKQSVEDVLVQRVLKTTIQILFDQWLFDSFPNAVKDLKDFSFVSRPRPDLG